MTTDERKTLAQAPITWTGDLSDDCTAEWAGLMLRAEWMDEDYWWWAVYDMQKGKITVDDTNKYSEHFVGGEAARNKAESVAMKYILTVTSEAIAQYVITDAFKITGRGFALMGYIAEGSISIGDTIEFTAFDTIRQRKITSVEDVRKSPPGQINTGLLIQCNSDAEIDELRNWQPNLFTAIVYKTGTAEDILKAIRSRLTKAKKTWWQKLLGSE